jgi:hypothetical protein
MKLEKSSTEDKKFEHGCVTRAHDDAMQVRGLRLASTHVRAGCYWRLMSDLSDPTCVVNS